MKIPRVSWVMWEAEWAKYLEPRVGAASPRLGPTSLLAPQLYNLETRAAALAPPATKDHATSSKAGFMFLCFL